MEMNHVLVVEDDKEIREGVEIYLKSQGYEVFQAADGIEGLEVIEKEEIHLAIVDIMMPRMDGIRMTMKLREKYDFPVIMLSAKSEEVDKIMGLNIGADDYVTDRFFLKDRFRFSVMCNAVAFYTDDLVGYFFCQIDLMKRHDHCDSLFLRHISENGEQFQFIAHVQK